MNLQIGLRWVWFWSMILAVLTPSAHAQSTNLGVTMTTSLIATQGETITYAVVITNRTSNAITGVTLSDILDPNTTLVANSINTSPLAFPDSYAVLGNVQITNQAPGVLANDVDLDGVGPALTVVAGTFASANGGNVVMSANGAFSYNPPSGFEGVDTFTYTLNDGEGFTDTGKVSLSVTGMIWFVNAAAPPGGDGRLSNPFNTLAALTAINNNAGTNPATNDSIFIYSGNYTGPLTLLNNQKLIGQGATLSLSALTGLTPPAGSLTLPATSGARPVLAGNNGIALASGNLVRGVNLNLSGGTALGGGSVGALTILEAAVTNTAGIAINLKSGTLNVVLNSVSAAGGANGIALANTTGSFAVTGDGSLAQNGTGGTIQNTTGNGVQLNNVVNISLARMNINNSAANGLFGLTVNGLVIDWCAFNNNGDAADESGIRLGDPVGAQGLIGTVPAGFNPTRIANTLVRASGEMNVAIFNNGGTLAQLDVTNVVSKDTRTRPLGADGFYFETRGTANALVNFLSCSFSNNFTQGIQASAIGQSTLNVTIANCGFTNNNEGVVLGNANDADIVFDINGNRFFNNLATGASGSAIAAVNATTVTPAAIYLGKVRNNTVIGGGVDNHLVTALFAGTGQNTLQVAGNSISAPDAQFSGIFIQAGEAGAGALNANVTVTGNTVSVGALGSHGIVLQSRTSATLCAEIASNTSTTGGVGLFGINVRQRDISTFRLPGFAGPLNSTAAVIAFLQGKNSGTTVGATVVTTYTGGASCTLPLFAMPSLPAQRTAPTVALLPDADVVQGPLRLEINTAAVSKVDKSVELTPTDLKPIIAAARQHWAATGLSLEQLAILDSLHFEVTNLAGWYLGASSGRVVQLDRRASGYGWFIDATPLDHVRYAGPAGRIDLLSTVIHEMGHQLGLADDYTSAARNNVMYGFLAPGERRLPVKNQALGALPEHAAGTHYIFAPINIGTLPAGKSIMVTFRATIANPVPAGTCIVSNQGVVTADGGISVVSDDPRTVAVSDPTITTLLVPPIVVTQPASAITGTSATLNGSVNPCGTSTGYYFQYGLTTTYGMNTTLLTLPAGVSNVAVSVPVTGLTAGAIYHFRIVATNSLGTNAGVDRAFSTPLDIVQQPTNSGACVGGTATFSVTASSTNVTYQWQRRAAGTAVFQNISGATAATYTTTSVTSAADGTGFRVIVTASSTSVTSAEALLSVITIAAPVVTYNFNNGLPADTAIYGNAFLSNGVLELNTNAASQTGAFLTTDLAPGRLVRGFTAAFKMRIQQGTVPPADGFSFNWATDLPNGIYALAEEGEGSGLRVCFDTYDNGLLEAPAIDVKWGTNVIARYATDLGFLPGSVGDFADVAIRLNSDGTLDVAYRCRAIFSRLPIPGYTPLLNARFGLGSRTGGLNESHGLDDLAIQLDVDPTNGVPRITGVSNTPPFAVLIRGTGTPGENVALLASTNFNLWKWRANVTPDLVGNFQFTENTRLVPYRFYRLGAAPQMPGGLVTWWRAESNFVDSFGPNSGSVTGQAPLFISGQRGSAFGFNGTNLVFIGGIAIPVPWTASFWVKRQDGLATSAALLTSPSGALKVEQFGTARLVGFTAYGVADYSFNYSAPTNVWTHLVFVATPGSTVLYTNGVAAGTNAATISLPMNVLGSRENNADQIRGQLDEITIFNRALPPAEITNLLNSTRGP